MGLLWLGKTYRTATWQQIARARTLMLRTGRPMILTTMLVMGRPQTIMRTKATVQLALSGKCPSSSVRTTKMLAIRVAKWVKGMHKLQGILSREPQDLITMSLGIVEPRDLTAGVLASKARQTAAASVLLQE